MKLHNTTSNIICWAIVAQPWTFETYWTTRNFLIAYFARCHNVLQPTIYFSHFRLILKWPYWKENLQKQWKTKVCNMTNTNAKWVDQPNLTCLWKGSLTWEATWNWIQLFTEHASRMQTFNIHISPSHFKTKLSCLHRLRRSQCWQATQLPWPHEHHTKAHLVATSGRSECPKEMPRNVLAEKRNL